jgi:hypothetical protein
MLHTDLHERLNVLQENVDRVHDEVVELRNRVDSVEVDARRAAAISRRAYDEEPANRRRVHALRRSDEYEPAFTESEPLVSFLIPTYDSFETLCEVAIPSILGQAYSNVEIVVVGDCAPPETAAAISKLGDPRVTYVNRTIRGPYSDDRATRWFAIGGPPFNDALALARGRWVAVLGDDDAVRPNHTEDLLAAAQANRYEHCYGRQQVNFAEGEPLTLGEFPPRLGHWGNQAAIYHSGLRFFEAEPTDEIYGEPSDWSKCRRMMRAGVRFGMIDKVVVDKNEWRQPSARRWMEGKVPAAD